MSRAAAVVVLVLMVLLGGAFSLGAFVSGFAVFGKDDASSGCATQAHPAVGGPYWEDTRVLRAERTLIPLGAVCVLDSPRDAVGPQTVALQSWTNTVAWLVGGATFLAGVLGLVRQAVLLVVARIRGLRIESPGA